VEHESAQIKIKNLESENTLYHTENARLTSEFTHKLEVQQDDVVCSPDSDEEV